MAKGEKPNKRSRSWDLGRRVPSFGAMRYPDWYVWFVFVSAMDIMLTWSIIELGGREVNPLADWVLQKYDYIGMVGYKFAVMMAVVLICEYIGRQDANHGKRLAQAAVWISAIPIVWSLILMATRL